MEVAVLVLGRAMGVTISDKHSRDLEWGKIVGNMADKLKDMSPSDTKDNLAESVSLLSHVKIAWRNTTTHPSRLIPRKKR
jgi:hypothetical protein